MRCLIPTLENESPVRHSESGIHVSRRASCTEATMSSVAARIAAAQAERDLSEAPVDIFHAFTSSPASQLDKDQQDEQEDEEEVGEPGGGRISMYVRIVHEMFETVLEGEDYLFTAHERAVLRRFLALQCEHSLT